MNLQLGSKVGAAFVLLFFYMIPPQLTTRSRPEFVSGAAPGNSTDASGPAMNAGLTQASLVEIAS
jgi:hypothetical protein